MTLCDDKLYLAAKVKELEKEVARLKYLQDEIIAAVCTEIDSPIWRENLKDDFLSKIRELKSKHGDPCLCNTGWNYCPQHCGEG